MSDSFQDRDFRSLGLASTGSGTAAVKKLDITIDVQEHDEWCWAAVAATTSTYFTGRPGSPGTPAWDQCGIVREVRRLTGEPTLPCDDPDCDKPGDLGKALGVTRNLKTPVAVLNGGAIDSLIIQKIQDEIEAERPVGVRVAWDSGGAHVCLITGVSATGFQIEDPLYDQSEMLFTVGFHEYQRQPSKCTHLYFTRQAS